MKWFLSYVEKFKEGVFVSWVGSKPFITVFKPEYLEVSNI